MRRNVVELPEKVNKVASLCNENNQIILVSGAEFGYILHGLGPDGK
ncbi:hypothetical protein [uncultured Campylobacter sp.]|nr:hypothetical protein [uncultured Campylobacter sp.]